MTFLAWEDTDKNTPVADKIAAAAERYQEKHGKAANVCLCSASVVGDIVRVDNVEVRGVSYLRPGIFWVGRKEDVEK